MKEEDKFEKNKYQLWEIVKILHDNDSDTIKGCTGFITEMRQFEWNGIWQYSIYIYECESVWESLEYEIESTGEFLPKEEIDERLKIISRNPKFDFNEIVEVVKYDQEEYLGKKGHILGMVQDYNTGHWGYSVSFSGKYRTIDINDEDQLFSTDEVATINLTV